MESPPVTNAQGSVENPPCEGESEPPHKSNRRPKAGRGERKALGNDPRVKWIRQYFKVHPDRLPGEADCVLARAALDRHIQILQVRKELKDILKGRFPKGMHFALPQTLLPNM